MEEGREKQRGGRHGDQRKREVKRRAEMKARLCKNVIIKLDSHSSLDCRFTFI